MQSDGNPENTEIEFIESRESYKQQGKLACAGERRDPEKMPDKMWAPQTNRSDFFESGFHITQTYDNLPQNLPQYSSQRQIPLYAHNSTILGNRILPGIPGLGFNPENPIHLLNSLHPSTKDTSLYPLVHYQNSANLSTKHRSEFPTILNGNGSHISLSRLEHSQGGNLNYSDYSDRTYRSQGYINSIKTLDRFIPEEHMHPNTIHTNEGLQYPRNDFQIAMQKYTKFAPFFSKLFGQNFKELLVEVLHECLHQISLDDFYNFLHNFKSPDQVVSSPLDGFKIDKSEPSDSRMEGLNFCHLILENFRRSDSRDLLTVPFNQNLRASANFLKVCKNFLAIKIIFDSVRVAENNSDFYLARSSIYKAYYIICRKLIQKYQLSSISPELQFNTILNQSQFGKLFKLKFPNLKARRFGRRGDSKFHYRGMMWNTLVIDEETQRLMGLALTEIKSHIDIFENNRVEIISQPRIQFFNGGNENSLTVSEFKKQNLSVQLFNKKPMYSFVDLSKKFLVSDCFPRSWESIPGQIPQQSRWAKETMEKSVNFLKCHNIDVEPLIRKIDITVSCGEAVDSFFEDVLLIIRFLLEVSAADELYLNLYLIVATLIFPIIFTSGKEISNQEKSQLRESLSNFVTRLEVSFLDVPMFSNLMTFANIMNKMITFNKLLLSQYRLSSTESIVRAMIDDPQIELYSDPKLLGDIIFREASMACNAFNWEFFNGEMIEKTSQRIILQNIANAYMKFAVNGAAKVLRIPELMSDEDLEDPTYETLYYMFEAMVKVFHEVFLYERSMLELPMKVISSFLYSIAYTFQNLSFRHVVNRETELSKEILRAWWVYLSAFQEYMDILSEINALSANLS